MGEVQDAAYCGKPWLGRYIPSERSALHAFLMGRHPVVGRGSPIQKLPVELIQKIFSYLLKPPFSPQPTARTKRRTLLKIVLLGNAAVGKTSLIHRYVDNAMPHRGYKPTIGADFLSTTRMVGDQEATLQIWDTAGQERFGTGGMGTTFFRGADAVILVYDITSRQSFDQLNEWAETCAAFTGRAQSNFFFVLGNKLDLDKQRVVPHKVAKAFCDERGYGYWEVSGLTGANLGIAMAHIVSQTLSALRSETTCMPLTCLVLDPDPPQESCGC